MYAVLEIDSLIIPLTNIVNQIYDTNPNTYMFIGIALGLIFSVFGFVINLDLNCSKKYRRNAKLLRQNAKALVKA